MEQRLTDARGLPGREWFMHFVYAPGRLTGYGVKTLPAVREALDAGRWDEANQYSAITVANAADRSRVARNDRSSAFGQSSSHMASSGRFSRSAMVSARRLPVMNVFAESEN